MVYPRLFAFLILILCIALGCPSKKSDDPGLDQSWNEFAKATNDKFWWRLPDDSAAEAKITPWPVPAGQPVKLEVLTSIGELETKIVERVDYVLTFKPDVEGMFKSMEKVKSSKYRDIWETTVVIYETEPFIRFRFKVNTPEESIEMESVEITFQE